MYNKPARIIRIKFLDDKISFIKSDTSSKKTERRHDGIKLELTIGRIFHKALNKTRVEGIFEKNDFEFLGNILFKLLCLHEQEDARLFVYNEIKHTLTEDTRGLIILDFEDGAADLAILPWEYLLIKSNPDKRIDAFYAGAHGDARFDLVRFIPSKGPERQYEHEKHKKLSIVQVICSPYKDSLDTETFYDCFEKLEKEFPENLNKPSIETWRLEDPCSSNFVEKLMNISMNLSEEYIVHFYGHARMLGDQAEIALINEVDGTKEWISHEVFAGFFDQSIHYKKPIALVMQACESGQLNTGGNGLAVSLINKNIPFVIGMQNEVTTGTSMAFFYKFYEALLLGHNFFEAVTIGRVHLGCSFKRNPNVIIDHYNDNSFGTPVVFSSANIPMRFFPLKNKQKIMEPKSKLICNVCGTQYPISSKFENCIRGRCRGELIRETSNKETKAPLSADFMGRASANNVVTRITDDES